MLKQEEDIITATTAAAAAQEEDITAKAAAAAAKAAAVEEKKAHHHTKNDEQKRRIIIEDEIAKFFLAGRGDARTLREAEQIKRKIANLLKHFVAVTNEGDEKANQHNNKVLMNLLKEIVRLNNKFHRQFVDHKKDRERFDLLDLFIKQTHTSYDHKQQKKTKATILQLLLSSGRMWSKEVFDFVIGEIIPSGDEASNMSLSSSIITSHLNDDDEEEVELTPLQTAVLAICSSLEQEEEEEAELLRRFTQLFFVCYVNPNRRFDNTPSCLQIVLSYCADIVNKEESPVPRKLVDVAEILVRYGANPNAGLVSSSCFLFFKKEDDEEVLVGKNTAKNIMQFAKRLLEKNPRDENMARLVQCLNDCKVDEAFVTKRRELSREMEEDKKKMAVEAAKKRKIEEQMRKAAREEERRKKQEEERKKKREEEVAKNTIMMRFSDNSSSDDDKSSLFPSSLHKHHPPGAKKRQSPQQDDDDDSSSTSQQSPKKKVKNSGNWFLQFIRDNDDASSSGGDDEDFFLGEKKKMIQEQIDQQRRILEEIKARNEIERANLLKWAQGKKEAAAKKAADPHAFARDALDQSKKLGDELDATEENRQMHEAIIRSLILHAEEKDPFETSVFDQSRMQLDDEDESSDLDKATQLSLLLAEQQTSSKKDTHDNISSKKQAPRSPFFFLSDGITKLAVADNDDDEEDQEMRDAIRLSKISYNPKHNNIDAQQTEEKNQEKSDKEMAVNLQMQFELELLDYEERMKKKEGLSRLDADDLDAKKKVVHQKSDEKLAFELQKQFNLELLATTTKEENSKKERVKGEGLSRLDDYDLHAKKKVHQTKKKSDEELALELQKQFEMELFQDVGEQEEDSNKKKMKKIMEEELSKLFGIMHDNAYDNSLFDDDF